MKTAFIVRSTEDGVIDSVCLTMEEAKERQQVCGYLGDEQEIIEVPLVDKNI